MNYFAHGCEYLDNPYFLAGTATPDWLSAADRRARVRRARAELWVDNPDPEVAAVARGIVRHHEDDAGFHGTRAFAELSMQFSAAVREAVEPDDTMRPSFLGHILVELLLDDVLIQENPSRLEQYYRAMDTIEPAVIEGIVNRIALRPTERLARFVGMFCRERFLWDYAEDGKLMFRLNQVLCRVGLPPLGESLAGMLPAARREVARRAGELLNFPTPSLRSPP